MGRPQWVGRDPQPPNRSRPPPKAAPTTRWGQSLFGDTQAQRDEGVHCYPRGQVVSSVWAKRKRRGPDFGFSRIE